MAKIFKEAVHYVNVVPLHKTTSIKHKTDYWQLTLQSKKVPGTSRNYPNTESGMDG